MAGYQINAIHDVGRDRAHFSSHRDLRRSAFECAASEVYG